MDSRTLMSGLFLRLCVGGILFCLFLVRTRWDFGTHAGLGVRAVELKLEDYERVAGLDRSLDDLQHTTPRPELEARVWGHYQNPTAVVPYNESDASHHNNSTVVLMNGPSGMGKSTAAASFAVRFSSQYSSVMWLPCGSKLDLYLAYQAHARRLGLQRVQHDDAALEEHIPEEEQGLGEACSVCHDVREWVERQGEDRVLMVYDNVNWTEFGSQLEDMFLPRTNADILLTTTERRVSPTVDVVADGSSNSSHHNITNSTLAVNVVRETLAASVFEVTVGPVGEKEGAAILCLGKHCTSDVDRQAARRISQAVGGWPLAISMARAYMRTSGLSIKDLEALLVPAAVADGEGTLFAPVSLFGQQNFSADASEEEADDERSAGQRYDRFSADSFRSMKPQPEPAMAGAPSMPSSSLTMDTVVGTLSNAPLLRLAKSKAAAGGGSGVAVVATPEQMLQDVMTSLLAKSITKRSRVEQELVHVCAHLSNNHIPQWLLTSWLQSQTESGDGGGSGGGGGDLAEVLDHLVASKLLARSCSSTGSCWYTMHPNVQKLLLEAPMFTADSLKGLHAAIDLLGRHMERFDPDAPETWSIGDDLADHAIILVGRVANLLLDGSFVNDHWDVAAVTMSQLSLQRRLSQYLTLKSQARAAHAYPSLPPQGFDLPPRQGAGVHSGRELALSQITDDMVRQLGLSCIRDTARSQQDPPESPDGLDSAVDSKESTALTLSPPALLHHPSHKVATNTGGGRDAADSGNSGDSGKSMGRVLNAFQHFRAADHAFRLKRLDVALSNLNRSLQLLTTEVGEQHPVVGDIRFNMGLVHYAQGDFKRAASRFYEALLISKRSWGTPMAANMKHLNTLCDLSGRWQRLLQAPPPYRSTSTIATAVCVCLGALLGLYYRWGDSLEQARRKLPLRFWSDSLKLDLLIQASDAVRGEREATKRACGRRKRGQRLPRGPLETALQTAARRVFDERGWASQLDPTLRQDLFPLDAAEKRRSYDEHSLVDLLRVIRNKARHRLEDPFQIGDSYPSGFLAYFCARFPAILEVCQDCTRRFPVSYSPSNIISPASVVSDSDLILGSPSSADSSPAHVHADAAASVVSASASAACGPIRLRQRGRGRQAGTGAPLPSTHNARSATPGAPRPPRGPSHSAGHRVSHRSQSSQSRGTDSRQWRRDSE